jgi:molybdate/tungstate transport system substrate-binding protein
MEVCFMKRTRRLVSLFLAAAFLIAATALGACAAEKLTVFHAGSLSAPMAKIEAQFEKLHPDVDVQREAGGSAALARKIIDLDGKCDVYFSADYMVIERLLRPDFADWNVMFASNSLVLMYGPKSKYADEINGDNWYDVILRPDVRWGHSDPDADPCGYRSLMVLQLAQKYYKADGLYEKALADSTRAVRPKAIDLIAMVESGAMDYAFEYKSVAVQHGLKYVELPAEINLKSPEFKDLYASVSVERAGKKPGTKINTKGAPVVYGFTMPRAGANPEMAKAFVEYILNPEGGLAVFQEMGQDIVGPKAATADDKIPACFKSLLK